MNTHIPINEIIGRRIESIEEQFGSIKDLYFDDEHWRARYLVLDTGGWLTGRQVLISPESVTDVPSDRRVVTVSLTKEQVEGSPGIGTHEPLNRRHERQLAEYYGWSFYWTPMGGSPGHPLPVPTARRSEGRPEAGRADGGSELLSVQRVKGSEVYATDGEVGHVHDMVVEVPSWGACQLVLDTGRWLPGRKVLVPLSSIAETDWCDRRMWLRIPSEEVEWIPEFRAESLPEEACAPSAGGRPTPRGFCEGEALLVHGRPAVRP